MSLPKFISNIFGGGGGGGPPPQVAAIPPPAPAPVAPPPAAPVAPAAPPAPQQLQAGTAPGTKAGVTGTTYLAGGLGAAAQQGQRSQKTLLG